MTDLKLRIERAEAIARDAGALALDYFIERDKLMIENKRTMKDLVSEADREVELLIRGKIQEEYSGDGLIGEEYEPVQSETGMTWIIDPIDGTAPYLSGLPGWCVSIGLHNGDKSVGGVIYAPALGELYRGGEGVEARLNDQPMSCLKGDMRSAEVGFGMNDKIPQDVAYGIARRIDDAGANWCRYATGALELAFVAAGRMSGYVEPRMSIWDCAAGYALIEAAGGRIMDFHKGDALLQSRPVIGAAPNAFDELYELSGFDAERAG